MEKLFFELPAAYDYKKAEETELFICFYIKNWQSCYKILSLRTPTDATVTKTPQSLHI